VRGRDKFRLEECGDPSRYFDNFTTLFGLNSLFPFLFVSCVLGPFIFAPLVRTVPAGHQLSSGPGCDCWNAASLPATVICLLVGIVLRAPVRDDDTLQVPEQYAADHYYLVCPISTLHHCMTLFSSALAKCRHWQLHCALSVCTDLDMGDRCFLPSLDSWQRRYFWHHAYAWTHGLTVTCSPAQCERQCLSVAAGFRRPCGVVGRATFLTSRTEYRWRFDSALVQVSLKVRWPEAKANWRRPQKKLVLRQNLRLKSRNNLTRKLMPSGKRI